MLEAESNELIIQNAQEDKVRCWCTKWQDTQTWKVMKRDSEKKNERGINPGMLQQSI